MPRSLPATLAGLGALGALTDQVLRRMEDDYARGDELQPGTVAAMYGAYAVHTTAFAWAACRRVWPVPVPRRVAIVAGVVAAVAGAGTRLRLGGTLDPDDTTRLLEDALATQGDRRCWILEHWPHVVEYAQINDSLARGHVGPDPEPLLDQLAGSSRPALATAAAGCEPWLLTLASQLHPPSDSQMRPDLAQLLAHVADYRTRWTITERSPLGTGASDPDQAAERALLTAAVDEAKHRRWPQSIDDGCTFEPDPETRQLTLDDALGLW